MEIFSRHKFFSVLYETLPRFVNLCEYSWLQLTCTPYIHPCVVLCVHLGPDLGVCDGERVHPHAPAAPLVLNGVIKKDAKDGVHHLCDLLLLTVLGVNKAQRQHPLLPHRALQQTPTEKNECVKKTVLISEKKFMIINTVFVFVCVCTQKYFWNKTVSRSILKGKGKIMLKKIQI